MPEKSPKLFDDVWYYMSKTLPVEQARQLAKVLDMNGGTAVPFDDPQLTHYVTNSPPGPDSLEPLPHGSNAQLVTAQWIERSLVLSTRQEAQFYSPAPHMLFAGVIATATDLTQTDNEVLCAGITSLGGQWRTAFTKDVTHLFAMGTTGAKYATAMHFRDVTGVRVVVPHWFDDAVRMGIKGLATEAYEFPEPQVLKEYGAQTLRRFTGAPDPDDRDARRNRPLSPEKKALYDTALAPDADPELPAQRLASADVWGGRRILLSATLQLSASQKRAHKADIERGGGAVVACDDPEDEEELVEAADIYVTRYRAGQAYVRAYKLNKTIGTLPWLWYVRSTGILSRPTDQLLHYPVPRLPIDGFARHVITVTNYTGKDRDYIKKLIAAMGAEFTPTMSGRNTIVIAAYQQGTKTTKAASWHIPVVHHLWLEDCFIQWRDLSPAHEKYIVFPPAVDLAATIGTRALGGVAYDDEELAALGREPLTEEASEGEVSMRAPVASQPVEETPGRRRGRKERESDAGGAGDMSAGAYMDIDVPIDDDGRLSDIDMGNEVDEDVEDSPSARKARQAKAKAKASPGKRSPAKAKATPRSILKTKAKAKTRDDDDDYEEDEDEGEKEEKEKSPAKPPKTPTKPKLVRRFGRPSAAGDASAVSVASTPANGAETRPASAARGLLVKRTYGGKARSRSRSRVRSGGEGDASGGEGASRSRSRSRPRQDDDEDEDEDKDEESTTPKRARRVPASARTPGSARRAKVRDEDEYGGSDVEVAPTPKRVRGRPRKEHASDEDEEDEMGEPKRGRGRPRKPVANDEDGEEEEEEDEQQEEEPRRGRGRPRKVSAAAAKDAEAATPRTRGRPRKVVPVEDEDEDEAEDGERRRGRPATRAQERPSASQASNGPVTRARSRSRVAAPDEDDGDKGKTKKVTPARPGVKRKQPVRTDSESEGEGEGEGEGEKRQERGRERGRAVRRVPSGGSVVEVLVPTVRQVRSQSRGRGNVGDAKAGEKKAQKGEKETEDSGKKAQEKDAKGKKAGKKTEKTAAVAVEVESEDEDEEDQSEPPPKRGRGAPKSEPARDDASPAPAATSTKPRRSAAAAPVAGPSSVTPAPAHAHAHAHAPPLAPPAPDIAEPDTPASIVRSSKRSAASKATARLHNEVMPDLVSFQRELKTGHVRGAADGEEEERRHSEKEKEKEKGKGKEKEKGKEREGEGGKGKGKKRAEAPVSDGEEEERPERKKARTGRRKGRKSDEVEEGEESAGEDVQARGKAGAAPTRNVVVLTTQVTVSEDISKGFAKLGGKFTTKPSECTHLVAPGLVRTEKFMCGLSFADHIVNKEWLEMSALKKKFLPEDTFPLRDPKGEDKWEVKIPDVMQRRQAARGKLFAGLTFYVTPRVPVDVKLLRAVVGAGGGTVVAQAPTARMLKGHSDRFVISNAEDAALWRPLAQAGYPVYSQELILAGAMKQLVEWDAEKHKVPGSF